MNTECVNKCLLKSHVLALSSSLRANVIVDVAEHVNTIRKLVYTLDEPRLQDLVPSLQMQTEIQDVLEKMLDML